MMAGEFENRTVESYMLAGSGKGYYLLCEGRDGEWYWGPAWSPDIGATSGTSLSGPYQTRGEALIAGEDWVAASLRPSFPS